MATKNDRKRKGGEKPPKENTVLYYFAIYLLGWVFGFLHRWHVSTLFENDRHFSHLSEIEREMSFRTEMGFYYSYYKTLVESKTFEEGARKIREDYTSEYGNVINAYGKYNLLPEYLIGYLYHIAKFLGIISKEQCWQVERGDGISPVTSCEGLGVPIYFYLEIVWITTIPTAATLFKYSTYLSNSVFGGIITMFLFFYNHNESTRVQWTPPLRESFAYPMLLFQMHTITVLIRTYMAQNTQNLISWRKIFGDERTQLFADICISTAFSLSSWQFSHFVLTTQIIALLILKWFKIIPNNLYSALCTIHGLAALVTVLFTDFYSIHLLYSLYACLLISSTIANFLVGKLTRFLDAKREIILEITITILLTKWLKLNILTTEDDAHIYNILKSKLTDYKDFHTMLYTCSAEFDFLQYKTYETLVKTLLLPTAILAGIMVLYYWYRNFKSEGYPRCIEADVAYSGLQTSAFIIMAVFIMRLKLFMTPHLCIIAGSVCSKRYLEKLGIKSEIARGAIIVLLIAGMSHHGIERLQEERGFIGEYSNIQQEELFEWIKQNTPKDAVFAGKMSLMANLMLSTGRSIVNNPYYESAEMRNRTLRVYEIFSRKDAVSVFTTLWNMRVGYVVLEEALCFGFANMKSGCQMIDLWDMMDNGTAKAAGKPPLCPLLFQGNAYPFRRAFVNNHYVILQLNYSHYFEYKPLHYQF